VWRKVTLLIALGSSFAGCMNLPVEVRAELDCVVASGTDHFGNPSCEDSAR
jgi:hypothetical protein